MRLQQTLAPRAEAGAGRTQVRWYPTHEYQRDPPSTLLAPTLPLDGEEKKRNGKLTGLPLLTAAVISTLRLSRAWKRSEARADAGRRRLHCSVSLRPCRKGHTGARRGYFAVSCTSCVLASLIRVSVPSISFFMFSM